MKVLFATIRLMLACAALSLGGAGAALAQLPVCDTISPASDYRRPMSAKYRQVGDKRILLLVGDFEYETGKTVEPYIRNSRSYSEVYMCSSGGSVKGGMDVGRALSRAKATVRTPRGFNCISACTIAAMGGYARIIEDGAHFVIHSSSAFMSFGYNVQPPPATSTRSRIWIECDDPQGKQACQEVIADIKKAGLTRCNTADQLSDMAIKCQFGMNTQGSYVEDVILNTDYFLFSDVREDLVRSILASQSTSQVKNAVDLLKYYQEMLLDGQSHLMNEGAYRSILNNFDPVGVYSPDNRTKHVRNLREDIKTLNAALNGGNPVLDIPAQWQIMLTDMELSVKEQFIEYILSNKLDLGPAGQAAVKMFEAMHACQIQSACELEPHQAEALGYHNMFDFN